MISVENNIKAFTLRLYSSLLVSTTSTSQLSIPLKTRGSKLKLSPQQYSDYTDKNIRSALLTTDNLMSVLTSQSAV